MIPISPIPGKSQGRSLTKRHGPDKAIRVADYERQNENGYQNRHQLHQAGENLALEMAFNALSKGRPLTLSPTQRLLLFDTHGRLPRVRPAKATASKRQLLGKYAETEPVFQ